MNAKPNARSMPGKFLALVQPHPLMAIHDEHAHENAMEYIDALASIVSPTKGQIDYLESLSVLVGEYEDERWEPGDLDPVDLLRTLMAERDMSVADLGRLLGERSLGGRILNRDRSLSKTHIRKLAAHFGVRADLFL